MHEPQPPPDHPQHRQEQGEDRGHQPDDPGLVKSKMSSPIPIPFSRNPKTLKPKIGALGLH